MLELKNITLKWISPVEKILIENLNIKIENSEILCVFGESGVGKSSLINVISGVHEENFSFEGEIRLNGKNLNNTPTEKRKIGLLLQDGTLFPHLTVEQNLLFGMNKSLKRSDKNNLIIEYLDKAKMSGFKDIGHQEIFKRKTRSSYVATMLVSGKLRCMHLSTHLSLSEACNYVTKENVERAIKLTYKHFSMWGFKNPKIGVAALNPQLEYLHFQ